MNPILGHNQAWQEFAAAFTSARLHHAWLITGAEGIGKATLAYRLAAFVLSGGKVDPDKPDVTHPVMKLMQAEAHPDLLVVRRPVDEATGELKKGIGIDDVLRIEPFFRKTASHGAWRVVILEDAHLLNRNAQNAILKIVEEPPQHALILMTVTAAGTLLPTIRSRSRMLALAPLDDDAMRSLLLQSDPTLSAEQQGQLIKMAGGSIGLALQILRSEASPLYDELLEILRSDKATLDRTRVQKLAEKVSRKADAEGYEVLVHLLLQHLREGLRADVLATGVNAATARQLEKLGKIEALFQQEGTANLDRKLTIVNAVAQMVG